MKLAVTLLLTAACVALSPAFARAQEDRSNGPGTNWQITAYGLWAQAGAAPRGSGHVESSAPLVPLVGLAVPQQTSLVSSWFFGAGASLIGAAKTSAYTHKSIASLDTVLTQPSAGPQGGPGFGLNVVRRLRGRTSLEFALDVSRTGTGFGSSAQRAIESARSTYEDFFMEMVSLFDEQTGTARVTAVGVDSRPSEITGTAAVRLDWREGRALPIHVTAGGGLVRSVGQDANVTLVNEYAFNPVNFRSALHNAFAEVDRVVLHVRGPRYRPLAIFGIGTSQRLTARSGIDLDVRAGISRPSATVTVDAAPGVALVSDPDLFRSGIMSVSGTPFTFPVLDPITVMLFNSNAETTPRWPSSLSGPAVTAMQTFSGHSLQVNAVFRFGLYYRF